MKPRRFITYTQLVERGLFNNRVTLRRAIQRYGFPEPFRPSGRNVVWDEEEVEAYMMSRRVRVSASHP
jgi:predicted DNA-binding transcriptional regulator AlpA